MKKLVLMLTILAFVSMAAAQVTLKGIVTGAHHHPLPGANVVLEGTYYGVSAGRDGSFLFTHLKPGKYSLLISFIGYETRQLELTIDQSSEIEVVLTPRMIYTEEVLVQATRAQEKTPFAFSNVDRETLQENNMGQDIPYMLAMTPSFVVTSDAGAGIGYTSFRVRGTDLNRMNVTVNGIPLNDAESHSTFFVDQPDLVSSAENIQVQRGAGTSSGGGAAFGATINLQTLALKKKPYTLVHSTGGSFNSYKNSVSAGTGLIREKFTLDARLSRVSSDGYIDRASSNLKSFFLSAGYYSSRTVLKANIFSGWEETYQAWNGIPSVRLNNDTEGMNRYREHGLYSEKETAEMIASDNRTYNLYTYKNQVDHYQQDHFHVHLSHRFNPQINLNAAIHYTHGRGYYEQFKAEQKFGNYGLAKPIAGSAEISRTDLVRRKWLDNDFYGTVFSLNYLKNNIGFSWGGGWNNYNGRHFGRLIWGEFLGNIPPDYEWYRNNGNKSDGNSFAKMNIALTPGLNFFADIQFRFINYEIEGIDDDLRELDQQHRYSFFNPKTGIFYRVNANQNVYVSIARTNREPNRDNFVDTPPTGKLPEHETMNDLEMGWNLKMIDFTAGVNLYRMDYVNQLVLTGQINDVGAPVMTNADQSSRTGAELSWGLKLLPSLQWDANITFSRNKIRNFTEFVDDWDNGGQKSFYRHSTDLSFSPSLVANNQLTWHPGNFSFNLGSNYVGKQYIDNTSSGERLLKAYWISHLKTDYSFTNRLFEKIVLQLQVNNILDREYESNAWVYSYILGGQRYKMDGYFPQAGRHYMVGLEISF